MWRGAMVAMLAVGGGACGILGPSCPGESGSVALADAPRPQLFVTRVECETFDPSSFQRSPACTPLSRAGWTDGHGVTSYIITHGRGNPETLGAAAQYKIWIELRTKN